MFRHNLFPHVIWNVEIEFVVTLADSARLPLKAPQIMFLMS